MNTFTARPSDVIKYLSDDEISDVKQVCKIASENDEQVTIQIGYDHYDETEYYLYGVFTLSDAEVENYMNSGGLWQYNNPKLYLDILK